MGPCAGNATEAAKAAGYAAGSAHVTACRLLKKANVKAAIDERASTDPRVADREERQRFLTSVLRGDVPKTPVHDRVKAVEVLGKMQGDFIKRVQLEHVPPFRLILDDDASGD